MNSQCNTDCYDPTTALVRQNLATDEMVFISQQANHDLAWYNHNYIYDDTAGEDIEVYIIDTGANLAHTVSVFEDDCYAWLIYFSRNLPVAQILPAKQGGFLSKMTGMEASQRTTFCNMEPACFPKPAGNSTALLRMSDR